MIEGEDQEILLNTLAETPQEEVHTIEEDIYVIGVESLNGKAGDLTLKAINGEDLVGTGNIELATKAEHDALVSEVATKQAQLTEAQLTAANSGIDSTKVGQIATNAANIATLQNTKQDSLTQAQLNAINSGIDATKVGQIATNSSNITSNADRITVIEGKIPSTATSDNKLTDKSYVDNAIATNTANYISDNGRPFQSLADLQAYSGPLTNNDYAFVETVDSVGNDIYTRYKYNADQNLWAEEYAITNPTFTSDQWASINSGIAANDVAQIGTNKTDIAGLTTSKQDKLTAAQEAAVDSGIDTTKVTQIATNATNITSLQTGKQDKLTAGSNIQINGNTISATDTKYTAGTGLTLTGTQFSVNNPVPDNFFTGSATTSGEGSTITLQDTTTAPLDTQAIKGDAYQQTYSGKNLWSLLPSYTNDTSSARWVLPDTAVSFPAGTYTFSSSVSTVSSANKVNFKYANNTDNITIISDGTATVTFTEEVKKVAIYLSGEATISNIQLEAGSTATTYEPYVGGIPSPNPDYPQDIQVVSGDQTVKVTGKNLAKIDDLTATSYGLAYTFNSSGTIVVNNTSTATSTASANTDYPIALIAGQTYTLSLNNPVKNSDVMLRFQREAGGVLSGAGASSVNRVFTFTAENTENVRLQVRVTSGVTLNNFTMTPQLELGSTATSYEPYQSQTYPLTLGNLELAKIGTYQDYIWKDGSDWKVHKAVGKVVLNGTETWTQTSNGRAFYTTQAGVVIVEQTVIPPIIGNYYTTNTYRNVAGSGDCGYGIATHTSSARISIRNKDITTAADFKTWLGTHNTTVYYALATPTDTVITDETLIEQLEDLWRANGYNGQTNITVGAVSPNLAGILTVEAFKNNTLAGIIGGMQAQIDTLETRVEELGGGA